MPRRRRSQKVALGTLASPDPTVRSAGIIELGFWPFDGGGARPPERELALLFERLSNLARTDSETTVRVAAVYVLGRWYELRAAHVLHELLRDVEQPAPVQGHAAEGLALILGAVRSSSRRTKLMDEVAAALRSGLRSAQPEVRFWCIYALGTLKVTEARAELKALCSDDAVCPGLWRVSDEARDALAVLDGHPRPARTFVS